MKKRAITAMGLAAAMMLSMCVPAMAETTDGDVTAKDYTLSFVADPTVVDSGFVYAPVNINIPAGTDKDTTLNDLIQANGIEVQGSATYVSGIKCAAAKSFALTDTQKAAFPEAAFDTRIMVDPSSDAGKDDYLSEKEFTGYSGWMMTVDNKVSEADASQPWGAYYYTMGSTIGEMENYGLLDDGKVVLEMFFSLNMGADIGMGTAYLPTTITSYDDANGNPVYYYDWNGPSVTMDSITKADRTELVYAMANAEDTNDPTYINAVEVLKNLTSDSDAISAAIDSLNE